ncbi:hypothetical protein evm_014761 [Chilo suppressalis]|nr:hypothetical protein evm_014761 [Chilo suppressalis]
MASVKVAVRVRPFNQREKDMGAKLIVQMDGKKTRLQTVKNSKEQNDREKYKDFTFDHSYWSYDAEDKQYASQEQPINVPNAGHRPSYGWNRENWAMAAPRPGPVRNWRMLTTADAAGTNGLTVPFEATEESR